MELILQTNMTKLQELLEPIQSKRSYIQAIKKAKKKCTVAQYNLESITPLRAKKIYEITLEKYSQKSDQKNTWVAGEKRLYIWLFLCYCHHFQKSHLDLNEVEFQAFSEIFNNKNVTLLKFEANAIIKQNKKVIWEPEQDIVLKKLVGEIANQTVNWSTVSMNFFLQFNSKKFKSSKQCRERWLNHLDSRKIKGSWTDEHDLMLFDQIKEEGKKWAKITGCFKGRKTQHMVKNRFNSIMRKWSKKHPKVKELELIDSIIHQLQGKTNPHLCTTIPVPQLEEQNNDSYEINEPVENNIEVPTPCLANQLAPKENEPIERPFCNVFQNPTPRAETMITTSPIIFLSPYGFSPTQYYLDEIKNNNMGCFGIGCKFGMNNFISREEEN